MRYSLLAVGLMVSSLAMPMTACAQQEPEEVTGEALPKPIVLTPELLEAYQDYRLAQLRWQQYRMVELPRTRQLLNDQVRLSESSLRVLRRRVRDYRPFLAVGRYSPARTAAENDQLALQAAEAELRLQRNDRINHMRYSRQNSQLYQLEVYRTAARVLAVQREQLAAQAAE